MSMRYPKEHREFILANYKGIQSRQLAELVNMEFGTSYTDKQMHAFIHNRHLRSGSVKGVMKGSCTDTFPKPIADFITENYKGSDLNRWRNG